MRAHAKDVPRMVRKHGLRDGVGTWWDDWPWRHKDAWHELLLQPGAGWLRWSLGEGATPMRYDPPEPPEPYSFAPPLRRVWLYLRWAATAPRLMIVGIKHDDGTRYRYAWEEARPGWSDCWRDMRDPERGWSWR